MKKVLLVLNDVDFFLSHRLPIGVAAQEQGYQVHLAAPPQGDLAAVRRAGFTFHPLQLSRGGTEPWRELATLWAIFRLYRRLKPDLVHHVTIKPVLYGGLMSRLARVPSVVHAVSGLGYVFIAGGVKAALVRRAVKLLYRLALGRGSQVVIFQNPDDRAFFASQGVLSEGETVLIKGSGVDLGLFHSLPEPPGEPLVVLASRLLWDKGVGEFVAAAAALKERGVRARFALVGDHDSQNPTGISTAQLESWRAQGVVECWGMRRDMPVVLSQAHIVCLPSYREGLPKVLIEAAAAGRPIVSTDVPGCREIVRQGENGILVPARDPEALAQALLSLIEDPLLRRRMGEAGRRLAEAEYSVQRVVQETLEVYDRLIWGAPCQGGDFRSQVHQVT